jgi:hypothetical protein
LDRVTTGDINAEDLANTIHDRAAHFLEAKQTCQIESNDYSQSSNPPILHRMETFLPPEHPLRKEFARLPEREEKHGRLDEPSAIGTREGWKRRLEEKGYALRAHRLVRTKP